MKNRIYIVLIFLVLLSISAVSAADDSTSDIISADDNQELILDDIQEDAATNTNDNDELILEDATYESVDSPDESPTLNAGQTTGSFSDLNATINGNNNNQINLTKNYTFNGTNHDDTPFMDGITISRSLTIDGKGHSIKGKNISKIFNIEADNVLFKNINFIDCFVNSSAIHWSGANGSIICCNFINCTSYLDHRVGNNFANGSAVYWTGENGTIANSSFVNCSSFNNFDNRTSYSYGGAIYWTGANGSITNSNFMNCNTTAHTIKNSVQLCMSYSYGGAIYWTGANGSISNSNFMNCSASSRIFKTDLSSDYPGYKDGGAIYWNGTNGSFNYCNFTNNSAKQGGAIYSSYALTVNNSIFEENTVEKNQNDDQMTTGIAYGGAIYFASDAIVNNSIFYKNKANGICLSLDYYDDDIGRYNGGGALYIGGQGFISNSKFNRNEASDGGAIVSTNMSLEIVNSEFIGNKWRLKGDVGWAINLNPDRCTFMLEPGSNYINAIFKEYGDVNFSNVTYWNGEIVNTDDGYPINDFLSTQFNFTVYDYEGNILYNIIEIPSGTKNVSFNLFQAKFNEKAPHIINMTVCEDEYTFYTYVQLSLEIKEDRPSSSVEINTVESEFNLNECYINFTVENPTEIDIIITNEDGDVVFKKIIPKSYNTTDFNYPPHYGNYGELLFVDLPAYDGYYNMTVYNIGTVEFIPSEASKLFKINPYNSTINIAPIDDFVYGNTFDIEINGENLTTVNVTIYDSNKNIIFTQNMTGNTLHIPILPAGECNVTVINYGNQNISGCMNSTIFHIFKAPSQVNVNPTIAYEGDDAIIQYESYGDIGINVISISNDTATLSPGTDYTIESTGDGKIVITGLNKGIYTIKVETIVDGNHESNANQTELIVKGITSFSALQELINQATDNITIQRNYTFDPVFDSELTSGILINKDITIYGNDHTLDGNNMARIFNITENTNLTIVNLKVKNGQSYAGGAICNKGHLTVINSTFTDNNATNGGAIYNNRSGNLTVINSSFAGNNASYGGAIYNAPVGYIMVINSSFAGNNAAMALGGAIDNNGELTVINSSLAGNNATYGGALNNAYTGKITVINSSLESNTAQAGGGIDNHGQLTVINSVLQSNSAINGNALRTNNSENTVLTDVRFVDNGENAIYCTNGEVDTSESKFLTAVAFEIADIADFVSGSSITVQVTETLNGESFNGVVTIGIGTNNYTMEITNGTGSISVNPDLSYGQYTAKLSFAETDEYYKASAESNQFHVSNNPLLKIATISNFVTGSKITLKVTAIDTFNGAVNVVINGVNYAITLVNGSGTKAITLNLKAGSYKATVSYGGNENFTAANATSNAFTVTKKPTVIVAAAVTATYNVNKYIVATLKEKTGKLLAGLKVTIKLSNGKTYTRRTDKKGQVKLLVSNMIPKAYKATITFAGNDYESKATKAIKVTVKKATPKMTAKAKTFGVKVKVKNYAIILKTNMNKVMKNTRVTITVNKRTFIAKTNSRGVATFKITNLNKKGRFTAVIKYAGNKYYNKVTKKQIITVR